MRSRALLLSGVLTALPAFSEAQAARAQAAPAGAAPMEQATLHLSERETLEARGLSVLLYHNAFHGVFSDQKLSGLELILHGERIATNGDVRLLPTPAQWDPIPRFQKREADPAAQRLVAWCSYPESSLSYRIELTAEEGGLRIAVHLDRPLPEALAGRAGFNLEFLPSAFFGKSYLFDQSTGVFPRHPNGPMRRDQDGTTEPLPLASGQRLVLAPEDPLVRVAIDSETGPIQLFDGRNKAQNGWFVVRTLLPKDRTENALVWHVRPHLIPGWTRPPVVAYNQVGYTPERTKVAVLELDPLFDAPKSARLLRLTSSGEYQEALRAAIQPWGRWLRYQYARFDFSSVREPGLYAIEYAGHVTTPFRIASDVYRRGVWQPSLDTYLPVQMDHVLVREGYRVWHGASHLDDARQAPVNHEHFDGYRMGATTDSPFASGEHIPGLDQGGWFDAGDFDIRTLTQAQAVANLVLAREAFGLDWDETTVDEKARVVEIRRPDSVPDAVQQISHGVLALLAQYRLVGHAIPGIIEPTLQQYTHLGDAASKTDNRIYDPRLGPLETDGLHSGVPDDRWAFTNRSTPLDYTASAALAAASRVLRGFDDALAKECLETAARVWNEEHSRPPVLFESFNTAGGDVASAEASAAVELLLASRGGEAYKKRLAELLPAIEERFPRLGALAVQAMPYMDAAFAERLAAAARKQKAARDAELAKNPFGVPISDGTWGGSGLVAQFAVQSYLLHRAFPQTYGSEETLRAFDYLLGTHPVSNLSLVSTVGTRSKLIAYGNNRADYSFIPGGLVPGVLIVRPDFPELKEDWPFLWFENEYVVGSVTAFILAANAADALTREALPAAARPAASEAAAAP